MTDSRTRISWLVVLLGLLCIGAIVAAVLVVGPSASSGAGVTRTATVKRGVVQQTVSGSGNLAPSSQLDLGFRTSGTVTHVYVHTGQQVAEGQLLATLDPESAEVTLEQAKASLLSDEAALAKEEETDGEGSAGAAGSSDENANAARNGSPSSGAGAGKGKSGSGSSAAGAEQATVSAATREANLASAHAAVRSARLTVQGDEQAVQDTRLYAPESGTIVSLGGQVGEVVSASGTTKASSAASTSSSSSASSGTAAAAAGRGASSSAGGSNGSSGSSSSAFAVLSNLSSMELVVPLSESEVSHVKTGQIATVTVEALEGQKLAAHVSEVAILSTSNSGVVSYDVTFRLDQTLEGIKPGMSASAEVVVKQAEGLNVPTSAISARTVTVLRNGKHVMRRVVTGLAGDSSTIVLSGLDAGETVLLPSATTSSTSRSAITGRSGVGGAAGLGGLGVGGAGVFFRGGG